MSINYYNFHEQEKTVGKEMYILIYSEIKPVFEPVLFWEYQRHSP